MFYHFPITDKMVIHSLGGELAEATIIAKVDDNDYIAVYNGVKCHAIFNTFVCRFYVDDLYTVIEDDSGHN